MAYSGRSNAARRPGAVARFARGPRSLLVSARRRPATVARIVGVDGLQRSLERIDGVLQRVFERVELKERLVLG